MRDRLICWVMSINLEIEDEYQYIIDVGLDRIVLSISCSNSSRGSLKP